MEDPVEQEEYRGRDRGEGWGEQGQGREQPRPAQPRLNALVLDCDFGAEGIGR
ncbi:hypothetical protein ABZX75_27395 [Streptomyces sp. NPDC003038]|uniref:hypothetical protein n=1 Tax=unclassified Streptomyces TaxID=2593676 RepID=UPI0033B1A1C6